MTAEGEGAGMAPAAVEALRERARRDVEDGILPSCQIALAVDGRVALFETFGRDRRDPRYQVYSVTKALVAGAVWILLGEGRLATDTRVAEVIPGFGTNGKDAVRVEHLLTHTAGFPRAPMRPLEGADRERRMARFPEWRLDWEPGTRFEYHPRRRTGCSRS
ncbi:MAG TPA: serine hydrolase domain-containing protein [Actinomycetota bacterium]|nr:serine hydrolase domain-containing protein [Actinomycetota bacterium]